MFSDPGLLAGFLVTVTAIIVSPGPDTMLIIRHALVSGRTVGFATLAGVQAGLVGHTLLAVFGVSVVIASSPLLFRGVAVAGAGYLAWLGIQCFRPTGALKVGGGGAVSPAKGFRDAMVTNLLNPKVIMLYLALFPNFLDLEAGGITLQLLAMSAMLLAINTVWQGLLVAAADRARTWLTRPAVQTGVNRATGLVLITFACLMLWEHLLAG
jgi:threonine/homoserine/homoserine lactone efflux protein